MQTLILAITILMQVESSSGIQLYNKKEQAYGILQIRAKCLRDVNKYYKTRYTLDQCHKSPLISKWVFIHYIRMYKVNEDSLEDICRFWNGGPKYGNLTGLARKINNAHWKRCMEVRNGLRRRQR